MNPLYPAIPGRKVGGNQGRTLADQRFNARRTGTGLASPSPFGLATPSQALSVRRQNPQAFMPPMPGAPAQPQVRVSDSRKSGPAGQVPPNSRAPFGPSFQAQPPARPSAPPEQASVMQSAMPGYFNGNPTNGVSTAEASPAMAARKAQDSRTMGATRREGPATPPAQQYAPQSASPVAAAQQFAAPSAMPVAAAGESADGAAAPVGAPAAPPAYPEYGYNPDFSFTGSQGKDRTLTEDIGWGVVGRQPDLSKVDYARYGYDPARNFWSGMGIKGNHPDLPSLVDYQRPDAPIVIPWDTSSFSFGDRYDSNSPDGLNPYYIDDRGIRELATKYDIVSGQIRDMAAAGAEAYSPKDIRKVQEQAEALQAMLARYGYLYNPRGSGVGGGGGASGDPGGTPPIIDDPGGGGPAIPPVDGSGSGQDVYTPPGDQAPGYDDSRDDLNFGDTDLNTTLGKLGNISSDVRGAWNDKPGGTSAEEYTSMLELEMQRRQLEEAMVNKQKGVNLLQADLDRLRNDPLRTNSEAAAASLFDDPSGVDWQGIRNRRVSDSDMALNQAIQAMSGGASRRGLDMGSMAGMAGDLTLDAQNRLSRELGELSTQEQLMTREGLLNAITTAGNTNRAFSGAESLMRQALANAVMGAPSPAQNPYAGMANATSNLQALRLQEQLLAEAQDDKSDKYSAIGGVLGGAAGALIGGPMGAQVGMGMGQSIGGAFG